MCRFFVKGDSCCCGNGVVSVLVVRRKGRAVDVAAAAVKRLAVIATRRQEVR